MAHTRDQVMACYRVTGREEVYPDLDTALEAADALNQAVGTTGGYGRAVVVPVMAIRYPQPIPASTTGTGTGALRRAVLALPLLAAGAVYDQPVTWSAPMPTAVYRTELAGGAGLLGRATLAVVPGTQTAAGLTVRVTAALLVSAGAVLDVTAYA